VAKARCACGAKYRFPDASIGKRAKCKECGAVFVLQPHDEVDLAPIPLADEPPVEDEVAVAAREVEAPVEPIQGEVFVPTGSPAAVLSSGSGLAAAPAGAAVGRTFASDVLWTFLFLASPSSLITFVCLWLAMSLAPLVSCVPLIGLFLWLAVLGWYCAYLFEVLSVAAAGETDLPELRSPTAAIDLIDGLFKWIGSWVFVFIPAILYIIVTWSRTGLGGWNLVPYLTDGLAGVLAGTGPMTPVFYVLVYLGIGFWPMVVLCVALGGFASLQRLDLILWTILKTLPVYLLTLGLMLGAVFLQQGLTNLAGGSLAAQTRTGAASPVQLLGGAMLLGVLITGIEIYLDIVLMRLIGLYYHHFKERFAFSWG
jgi:hypothetical protein